jgi:dipeptidyl aminopeptidase/acylaminoacyl peptidase
MGAEARCQLRLDGRSHEGKVLLETDELRFRGDGLANQRGLRLTIPFASIRNVSDTDGALRVNYAGGDATFVLGEKAAAWAERIRSPKSLIDKLDVKPEHTVSVVALRDDEFMRALNARAARVVVGRFAPQSNIVFLGADDQAALARIANAATVITRDGAIWVVHPKGADALRDTDIFAEAKRLGLTYTKVARFSATYTAEKLVIPKAKR